MIGRETRNEEKNEDAPDRAPGEDGRGTECGTFLRTEWEAFKA